MKASHLLFQQGVVTDVMWRPLGLLWFPWRITDFHFWLRDGFFVYLFTFWCVCREKRQTHSW